MVANIVLPKRIAEHVKRIARSLGMSLEEYVLDILSKNLNPVDRARDYIEAAKILLDQACEELKGKNVKQAVEKIWGATALAIKAYMLWKEKKRIASHRELWEYKDRVAEELGTWIAVVFREASSLHQCFYEGWCTDRDVIEVLDSVKKLVEYIENVLLSQHPTRSDIR